MDNLHVRLNFNLSKEKESNTTAKKNMMKILGKCRKSLENIVLQSLQILYMFVLICIRAEIVTIFGSKMVTISAYMKRFIHIRNVQTSEGYTFRILQHFVLTRFCNFTNFNKFFTEIYFFFA